VPFYPASGNHDVEWLSDGSRRPYKSFFRNTYDYLATQPVNSHLAPESQKLWYSFRHATSLFVSLDSNLMIDTGRYGKTHALAPYKNYAEEQLQWVQGILEHASQDPTIKTKYVFFHHSPFFSKETTGGFGLGGHEDDRELMVNEGMRDPSGRMVYLLDLFRRYRVNAVFSGHEHYYERWRETIEENGNPVHTLDWVVVGSGGVKPRSSYDYGDRRVTELFDKGSVYDNYLKRISEIDPNWSAKLERVYPNRENPSAKLQSYTHVSVDGHEVRFETREVDGTPRDTGYFSR
jgi:hypothetical protein